MRSKHLVLAVLAVGLVAGAAQAELVAEFVGIDNSAGGAELAGYVTSDLQVTTPTDWLSAQLFIDLTAGGVYQNALVGGVGPASDALQIALPATAFDTYIRGGQATDSLNVPGGAFELGGNVTETFDTTGIDIAWGTTQTDDTGTFPIARFTLSSDAAGTFAARITSVDQTPVLISGTIAGGQFVPEPASMGLLAVGGLLGVLRRRRK